MGLLSALLGRRRASSAPWPEAMAAMGRAFATLQGQMETYPTGQVGIILRSPQGVPADQSVGETERELRASPATRRTPYRLRTDEHGYVWVLLDDRRLERLAEGVLQVGEALTGHGFAERLLAVVFPFSWKERKLYWIYNGSRGRFTPFAPAGQDQQRDYPLEERMEASLRRHLPTERQPSQWYPIWGMPI